MPAVQRSSLGRPARSRDGRNQLPILSPIRSKASPILSPIVSRPTLTPLAVIFPTACA
jgi:hypothetical protein